MSEAMPRLIVMVDMQNALYRVFHAMQHGLRHTEQTTPTPEETVTGLRGVLSKLTRNLHDPASPVLGPAVPGTVRVVHAWDGAGRGFRHTLFPEYKANRKPAPPELVAATTLAQQQLDGDHTARVLNWEADDVIATLVHQLRGAADEDLAGVPVVIVSADRDLLQLLALPRVYQLVPLGRLEGFVTPERFQRVLGFAPEYLPDYKALRGDESDGLPGVRGWGEKHATAAIAEYGHLEAIFSPAAYERADGRLRRLLNEENFVTARHFRDLTRLTATVPGLDATRLATTNGVW